MIKLFFNRFLLIFLLTSLTIFRSTSQTVPVTKTNPVKVYVHYMPWFSAPQNPGYDVTNYGNGATGTTDKWGGHWSNVGANTRYPDNFITVTGYQGNTVNVRDICAHYHPLIGPYDGKDTAVLEYHLLLMKLSGIDGVMIDWYGKGGNGAGDAAPLLVNSNTLIGKTANVGLKYSLIMEDAAWKTITTATDNGTYAINNYFSSPQFIKLGDLRGTSATNANAPLLGVFGPQKFKTAGQWNTILGGNTGAFLPLYNQSAQIGADAAGEFAWPYPQAVLNGGASNAWYTNLSNYYQNLAAAKNIVLGTAYPGFNDFYGANGADNLGIIPRTYGGTTTLSATLSLNTQYKSVLDGIQLATWNDFSEGTIIEPTVEEGFQSLDTIQRFTGVPYTEADLQQVYRFFILKKKFVGYPSKQLQLNQVFNYFTSLQIPQAVALMDTIENIHAPVVTVSSSGTPSEDGSTGTINISATNVNAAFTVHYTMSGTRLPTSYIATPVLSDSVILSPADTSVTFTIAAIDDTIINPNQTVKIQLSVDTAYNIIGKGNATLTVIDNDVPPCAGPIVVKTLNAPKIDGAADAVWSRAPKNSITQTISGAIQKGSTWQAMYDSVNLYLLVEVKDSNLSNIGSSVWDQDGVEVYIAGNNSKNGAYTSADHQYRFNWNVLPYSTENITGSTGVKTGIRYAIPSTDGGYTLETSIPWSSIGGTAPYNWKEIGFDINLNDQQNNAAQREATAGWNGTNNDNYQNTASFGTVALVACSGGIIFSAPVIKSIDTANGKEDKVFVYNILASNSPTGFNATGLPQGLSVDTVTGVISGVPVVSGVFNVTISSKNLYGTGTQNLMITIESTPPVHYSSIIAYRKTDGMVAIQWIVDSEIVIKQYEVERSTDSIHFSTINTINEIGNNNINYVIYNSIDPAPLAVENYYRIKGTSLNAGDAICYSPVAKVVRLNTTGVYPNPVTGSYINIPFIDHPAGKYNIRLINFSGQVVYSATVTVNVTGEIYSLQLLKDISSGIYQLQIINEAGGKTGYKIIIE